eukprot:jgi/Bigna1/131789/aug1.15_g6497
MVTSARQFLFRGHSAAAALLCLSTLTFTQATAFEAKTGRQSAGAEAEWTSAVLVDPKDFPRFLLKKTAAATGKRIGGNETNYQYAMGSGTTANNENGAVKGRVCGSMLCPYQEGSET